MFAKHFKLAEHVVYLGSTKISIAVGTPGRVAQLLITPPSTNATTTDAAPADGGDGALKLFSLSHIFLDSTYLDSKKRSILDIPETRDEIFKGILGNPGIMERLKDGKLKIVLY